MLGHGNTPSVGVAPAGGREEPALQVVKDRTFRTHLGCVVRRRVVYDTQRRQVVESITLSHALPLNEVAGPGELELELADSVFDRVARWRR